MIYCLPEELTYYEQLFYDIDKSHNLSYNIRDCVDSNKGIKHSEETCEKMSKNHADFSGKNHPNFGKHFSDKTKEKMSVSAKNKPSVTEETKLKMSESKKGKNNPMFGKHHSDEACKKISENHVDQTGIKSPRITKKEVVLRGRKLLKTKMSGTSVAKKLNIDRHIVYKIRNGFYNKMYSLTKQEYNPLRNICLEKDVVLKIIDMMNNNISIKSIAKSLDIGRKAILKIRKGYYDKRYNLLPKNGVG